MTDSAVHIAARKFDSWAAAEGFFEGYEQANIVLSAHDFPAFVEGYPVLVESRPEIAAPVNRNGQSYWKTC